MPIPSALNIDHMKGEINTNDKSYVTVSKTGAVKIGSGKYFAENGIELTGTGLASYEGVVRYNDELKRLQFCDGTRWINFQIQDEKSETLLVYSLLF